jgi:hypothetical protein
VTVRPAEKPWKTPSKLIRITVKPVGIRAGNPFGLVHGDHESYLWKKGKDWIPELPCRIRGKFTMVDLLQFVGDVSPIDGIKRADVL